MRTVIAPLARIDLNRIFDTIVENNGKRVAAKFVERIEKKIAILGLSPDLGKPMPHLAPGLRRCVIRPYLIFYRLNRDVLEIVRVFHGRRDVASAMLT